MLNKKYIYKTISWRVISVALTLALSYTLMGSVQKSLEFTAIYSVISSILYYAHEEFYRRIKHKFYKEAPREAPNKSKKSLRFK